MALFGLIGCNPFVDACGGRWNWKSNSFDDEEDEELWNDLTFVISTAAHNSSKPSSIPRVVQVDPDGDEDVSTIHDLQQYSNTDQKLYSYVKRGEREYEDLQIVMEELELELKEESSENDETISLDIIMGPKQYHPVPPSQIPSPRSFTSSSSPSHAKAPPHPSTKSKHLGTNTEFNTSTKSTPRVKEEEDDDEEAEEEAVERQIDSSRTRASIKIVVSSSTEYIYSASHEHDKEKEMNSSDSCDENGSSYSSACQLLPRNTTKRSFDFSSVYSHRYHPSPRDQNQSLSFQTSSTDTTMETHNRNRSRVRSVLAGILAH